MTFSIIIPLYNKEAYIKKTLESVLAQTYKEFEVIVVNDGSKDNSLQEAKKVSDPRIRVIDKQNGGVSSARNRGIAEAKNEWICFLDADDIMYPNCLDEYRKLHTEFPEIMVLCASIDVNIKKYPNQEKRYIVSNYYKANVYSEMRTGISLLCTDCICINKECLAEVGVFNPQYTHGEDLNLWDRLQEKYKFAKSEVAVAYYDMGAINRSDAVKINPNSHFQPDEFIKKPRISAPLYKHIIYGSKMFYKALSTSTNKQALKTCLRNIYFISAFVLVKSFVRLGIISDRGNV
nr:glycosyltransferase family 2 protein [uncultured Macellibacteroides sp.]